MPDVARRDIAAWLRRAAVPIESTEAHLALRPMLAGVRVLGLGEVTHGTKEFYQYKNRLLRHLVTELGFTIVAIEGSHSSAQVVDDYVVRGVGDRAAVLAEFGRHAMWDVEEFAAALDWLRAHNRSVPAAAKVRFHGLNMWSSPVGRARVLAYLHKVAPDRLPAVRRVFDAVAWGEARGMLPAHQRLDGESFQSMRELADFLSGDRDCLIAMTSPAEYDDVVRQAAIIRQWIACNLSTILPPDEYAAPVPPVQGLNIFARSTYLGRNLMDVMERAGPDAKAVVWAHTLHVGVGFVDQVCGRAPNMGSYLRDRLGDAYYAVAMETERGTYLTREFLLDQTLGDFHIGVIPPAPAGTLAWYLAAAGDERFLLDLRRSAPDPAVARRLAEPLVMHCAGWAHSDPPLTTTMRLDETYDGVIFMRETSATTPTDNARKAVAQRAVF
jgi:erythromycin esterase